MSDDRLDGGAAAQLAPDASEDAALLAGNEDATGILCVVAAVSLVDIGPLDRASGECLGAVHDVPQGATVIGVVGYRLGVQHEQATGSPAVVGDDGGLHAALVRRGGLAFADALHLFQPRWRCCCERICVARPSGRGLLQRSLALDLAADIADDPAQPAAQGAQLTLMSVELFGMGVAARHHRRGLGCAFRGIVSTDFSAS